MTPEYDKAIAHYHKNLKIVPVPLISWGIFYDYNGKIQLFNSIQKSWKKKENFHEIVNKSKKTIIITNTNLEIVFASKNITEMNGYQSFEIMGRLPKIFQGELTNTETTNKIRIAIKNKFPFKEILLNYKKDGSTYRCEIEAYPKFNKKGEFVNYIAIEKIAS